MTTVLATKKANEKRLFGGTVFTFRVTSEESNGSIMVADFEGTPGTEPPRHVHTIEDEVFIIKKGNVTFFVGDDIIHTGPGDTILLPVNVPHHFKITSNKVIGTLIATPGNIEDFFRQLSVPYAGNGIPSLAPPTEEQIQHFVTVTESFGMNFV